MKPKRARPISGGSAGIKKRKGNNPFFAPTPPAPGGTPAPNSASDSILKTPTDKFCHSEPLNLPRIARGRPAKARVVGGGDAFAHEFQERLKWGELDARFGTLVHIPPVVPDPTSTPEERLAEDERRRAEIASQVELRQEFASLCLDALEACDWEFFQSLGSELAKMLKRQNASSRAKHLRDREGIAVSNAMQDCRVRGEPATNANVREAMAREPLKTFIAKLGIPSALDRKSVERISRRLGLDLAVGVRGRPRKEDSK